MDTADYHERDMAKTAETMANLSLSGVSETSQNHPSSEDASTASPSVVFSPTTSVHSPWSGNGGGLESSRNVSHKLEDEEDVGSFVATAAASSVLFESEKPADSEVSSGLASSGKSSNWSTTMGLETAADVWGFPPQQTAGGRISYSWTVPSHQQRHVSTGEWTSATSNTSNPSTPGESGQATGRSYSFSDDSSTMAMGGGGGGNSGKYDTSSFLIENDFVMQDKQVPDSHEEQKTTLLRSMYSAPSGLIWSMPNTQNVVSPQHTGENAGQAAISVWDRQDVNTGASQSSNLMEPLPPSQPLVTPSNKTVPENNAAAEAIIQVKIVDAKGEFWGRTPIDQTTVWSGAPMTNGGVGDIFDANRETTESNVWSNEPPNGTRLWEEFYEAQGLIRSGRAGLKPIGQASVQRIVSTPGTSGPTFQPSPSGQMWPTPSGNAASVATWDSHTTVGGMSPSSAMTDNMGWPPSNIFSTGGVDPRRGGYSGMSHVQHQQPQMPPQQSSSGSMSPSILPRIKSDMTMRVQQVKYLCSLGYPRAEAQNALIMNNMDLDRALMELRERFGSGVGGGSGSNSAAGGMMHMSMGTEANAGGYVNGLHHPGSRLSMPHVMNDYPTSPGGPADLNSSTAPHLGQQITQQIQFALNSRLNSMNPLAAASGAGGGSHGVPGGAGGGGGETSAKLWQNLLILQNRLKQVNGDLNHLQMASQASGANHQLQVTYRTLCVQQQQLLQQISMVQAQMKSLPPHLLANQSPTASHPFGDPFGVGVSVGSAGVGLTRQLSQPPYGGLPQHLGNEFGGGLPKGPAGNNGNPLVSGGPLFSPSASSGYAPPQPPPSVVPPLPMSPQQSNLFDPSGSNTSSFTSPWQR